MLARLVELDWVDAEDTRIVEEAATEVIKLKLEEAAEISEDAVTEDSVLARLPAEDD